MAINSKNNPKDKSATAAALNQLVADSYGLLGQLHLAHWNVEGSNFMTLHQLFQEMYEELFSAIDELAEQVRKLGYYSEGGLKQLAGMSNVSESPSGQAASAEEFISVILLANGVVLESIENTIKQCSITADLATEDLMVGRLKVHQKHRWFLKSYLA